MLLVAAVAIGIGMRAAAPAAVRAAFDQWKLDNAASLAILVAACAVSVVLHECGHLAAALLLRFEVLGASLGPFRLEKLGGRWRFRLTPRSLFRGSVAAVPVRSEFWRGATMIVAAAGPAATLLAAIVSVFCASQTGSHPFWGAMSEINVLLFALALIPISSRQTNSVGQKIGLRKTSAHGKGRGSLETPTPPCFMGTTAPSDAKLFLDLWHNGPEAAGIALCFGHMRERALTSAADTSCAA
ncbi:MAG: site-2 protease family protein [Bryobacteraceae bacterium]